MEVPPNIDIEKVREAVGQMDIGSMVNSIAADPQKLQDMMVAAKTHISPEMKDMAKKMINNGQGAKIMESMKKRGMDPRAMRAEFLRQQNALKGLQKHEEGETQKAILITASRQLRVREIPKVSSDKNKYKTVIGGALHCENPVELSCSRLAIGPLENKEVRVWYDDSAVGKNKRASRIVGFDVPSEILVMINDCDLTEEDFLAVEKLLLE